MFLKKYANLYRFRGYFFRRKRLVAALIVCMIASSSMGVVASYLLSLQLIAISNEVLSDMVKFALLTLGIILIHHIAWFFWDKLYAIIGNAVAEEIRRDIITSTLNTRYRKGIGRSTGYYGERLNDDTNEISCFLQNVTGTLVDVLTNFTFLLIVIVQNWQCGLVFSVGLVALYLLDLIRVRVELAHTTKVKQLNEEMNSRLTETIRGMREIKGLGIKDAVIRRNAEVSSRLARQNAKMKNDVTFWQRVRTFTQWLIDSILVLMCALWLFPAGETTAVIILIIFNYKGLVYDTVSYFSKMKGYYVQGDYKAGRILEILDDAEKDEFGSIRVESSSVRIEVRSLSYGYGEERLLRDVSFTLAPGTASILIGPSGSGKSTLFSLLTKLNPVEDGRIFINGVDINALDEESLAGLVSAVSQEPFLFNDTVMNNLRIVRTDAADEEVFAACRAANVYDEICALPAGFDTCLTENGENLSGGQRQRLAVARALLKGTSAILFDEPTSALDARNHSAMLNMLGRLKGSRTIFVIAHRVEDLSVFDNVFEIVDGRVVQVR